jgi:ABC-2 type transport system permease protein
MNGLVRTELLKLRTTRLFIASVAAVPSLTALVAVAFLTSAGHAGNPPLGPQSLADAIAAPASIVTTIALLLGVLATAGEYRHRTITTTFLTTPRRTAVVTAKLVSLTIVGMAIALATMFVMCAIAVPWLQSAGIGARVDADVIRIMTGVFLSTALYGAMGVAIGALIRNQTAAIAAVLVWLLAVEGMLATVFRSASFLDWLPAAAGRAMVDATPTDGALSLSVAALVLIGYTAVMSAFAARFLVRRDVP